MTKSQYIKIAFEKLPHKCNSCGGDKRLTVHHRDFNRKNNKLENLEILCFKCHNKLHVIEITNKDRKKIKKLKETLSKTTSSFQLKINKMKQAYKVLQNKCQERKETQIRNHNFCQVLKDEYPEIYKEVVEKYKIKYPEF